MKSSLWYGIDRDKNLEEIAEVLPKLPAPQHTVCEITTPNTHILIFISFYAERFNYAKIFNHSKLTLK